jgi:hypothetical protein
MDSIPRTFTRNHIIVFASDSALHLLCGFVRVVVCRSRGDLKTMQSLNQFAIAARKRTKAQMEQAEIEIPALEDWGPEWLNAVLVRPLHSAVQL